MFDVNQNIESSPQTEIFFDFKISTPLGVYEELNSIKSISCTENSSMVFIHSTNGQKSYLGVFKVDTKKSLKRRVYQISETTLVGPIAVIKPNGERKTTTLLSLSAEKSNLISYSFTSEGYSANLQTLSLKPVSIQIKRGNQTTELKVSTKQPISKTDNISSKAKAISTKCEFTGDIDLEDTKAFTNFIGDVQFVSTPQADEGDTKLEILQKVRKTQLKDNKLQQSFSLMREDVFDYSISEDAKMVTIYTNSKQIKVYKLNEDGSRPTILHTETNVQAKFVKLNTSVFANETYISAIYIATKKGAVQLLYIRYTSGDKTPHVYKKTIANETVPSSVELELFTSNKMKEFNTEVLSIITVQNDESAIIHAIYAYILNDTLIISKLENGMYLEDEVSQVQLIHYENVQKKPNLAILAISGFNREFKTFNIGYEVDNNNNSIKPVWKSKVIGQTKLFTNDQKISGGSISTDQIFYNPDIAILKCKSTIKSQLKAENNSIAQCYLASDSYYGFRISVTVNNLDMPEYKIDSVFTTLPQSQPQFLDFSSERLLVSMWNPKTKIMHTLYYLAYPQTVVKDQLKLETFELLKNVDSSVMFQYRTTINEKVDIVRPKSDTGRGFNLLSVQRLALRVKKMSCSLGLANFKGLTLANLDQTRTDPFNFDKLIQVALKPNPDSTNFWSKYGLIILIVLFSVLLVAVAAYWFQKHGSGNDELEYEIQDSIYGDGYTQVKGKKRVRRPEIEVEDDDNLNKRYGGKKYNEMSETLTESDANGTLNTGDSLFRSVAD